MTHGCHRLADPTIRQSVFNLPHRALSVLYTRRQWHLCSVFWRCHIVGQHVVSDISIVHSCWSICAFVLNLVMLICYYACSLL